MSKLEEANEVISILLNSINSLPVCLEDFIGSEAYETVCKYMGWDLDEEEEYEDEEDEEDDSY